MKTSSFFFDLPPELIAQYPPAERGQSRLMTLDRTSGRREHRMVKDLPAILSAFQSPLGPPLLVFNNSRVRKARLSGTSLESGGETEFLLLAKIDSRTWKAMVPRARRRRPGSRYRFSGGLEGEIVPGRGGVDSGFRHICFDSPIDDDWLDLHGHIPLPPYISRDDEASDGERYQTVYADRNAASGLGPGASSAAPTAGLHFTQELLSELDRTGMERVFITLHVGLGTFLPVRSENIEDHLMHEEVYSISGDTARRINAALAAGRKIIAVGTTSVRTLESAADNKGHLREGEGITSIFIYPGCQFKITDALFTNFHTPGSTLLMLVSAFAGREWILESYAEAVRLGYRFFSYGDAMLIS